MEPYPHSCSRLASLINFISPNLSLSGYYDRQIKFSRIYIKNCADILLELAQFKHTFNKYVVSFQKNTMNL